MTTYDLRDMYVAGDGAKVDKPRDVRRDDSSDSLPRTEIVTPRYSFALRERIGRIRVSKGLELSDAVFEDGKFVGFRR